MQTVQLTELNHENIEVLGGYCLRSKPHAEGYKNKNNWLKDQMEYVL